MTLAQRATAEGFGTMFLLATIVGSGIMGERLSGGNVAIALLANALATGAMLVAIILVFEGISGAHFNPVVTLTLAARRELRWTEVPAYLVAKVVGAVGGVAIAHLMFRQTLFSFSQHARSGASELFSEFVATFGLLLVIWGCTRCRRDAVPFAVGAYIVAGYWFTSSTSFANPAVTIARSLTNTFSGIRPADAPGFIMAQSVGAVVATGFFRWFSARVPSLPKDIDVARESERELSGRVH